MNSKRSFVVSPPVRNALLVSPLFAVGSVASFAQGLGTITGLVADKSGAGIPGAGVTATQVATGTKTETKSNNQGEYTFPSLPPARYSISVSAPGFSTLTNSNVVLQADQSQTVNLSLSVGSLSQEIEVTSAPPQVDLETGTLSQVVDTKQVNELPLNGRNAAQLTTLTPGVVAAPSGSADQGNTKTFPAAVTISANGTRANQTSYLLDGGNNVDEYTNVNAPFPFPDALQEFSVQTSNYSAEYGQNAGAVVNVITKGGTNQFHGDLFEYVRNRVFNARNYFQSTVDPLKRNQFGGTIGGPVGLPKLWQSKNSFFFFGVQATRLRTQNAPSSTTVPTTANLAGNIPVLAGSAGVTNPFTGVLYRTNPTTGTAQVNTADFDPAALALLTHVAVATSSSPTAQTLNFVRPVSQNFLEYVARFDQTIGQKDRFTARYYLNQFANSGVLNLTNLPTYSDGSNINYQNALISEAHSFTGMLLNNFILSYQREYATRGPVAGGINVADLGVNIWQPDFKSIQSISVANYFSVGDNPHADFLRSNMTLADDLHWVKGSHNLAFGFHGEVAKVDVVNQNGQPGSFGFSATNGNTALANFLFGYLNSFTQSSGQFQQNRAKFWGVYAQDSWKVNHRLTFNYGVRYEPYLPLHEKGLRMGQFNPAAYAAGTRSLKFPNAPAGLLFAGDPNVPIDGIRPVYTNFMPRIGFAYDVFGDGKTSLRGGGGMFYDTRSNGLFNNGWIGSPPFVTTVSLSPAGTHFTAPYGSTLNPFPVTGTGAAQFVGTISAITFDPSGNFKVPLTYQWNLSVGQQITSNVSMQLAYVAGHGSHIFTSPELNPATYTSNATVANTNARRRYLGFGNISLTDMGGNSSYQSLQATLQDRLSHGLSLTFNYTWSKSIDNVPTGAATTSAGGGQSFVLPVYLPGYKRLDVGPSDFDHRNVFTAKYVWVVPTLAKGWAPLRFVLNGWQSAGLVQARTGDPFSLLLGQDISLTGLNRDVPTLVGDPKNLTPCTSSAHCKAWLNVNAFGRPAAGTFGNVRKNTFTGPNFVTFDTSFTRHFRMTESVDLQFRAEYFNVFNHTNFNTPASSLANATTFGNITTANDPRIAQLSLKLAF